ncbi:MAG: transcriptional repressor LexA [Gammaproteobacteria bacterium]
MKDLTPRQAQILSFIQETQERTGMPPTRAEIAEHFGFRSTYASGKHLHALAKKGAIELLPGTSRGIRYTAQARTGMPVVGRVAAGSPILAEQYIEDYYTIDSRLFRLRVDYLLRVYGMSMKDAGILDGDLLAVHKTPHAENGQIVVARLDGEVTVKRFKQDADSIALLPENSDFSAIIVDADSGDFCIEGIVVGSIRHDAGPNIRAGS